MSTAAPATYDIRHHLGIAAPQAVVHDALATKAGIAGWWTTTIDGDDGEGGKLAFFFGGPERAAVVELADLSADHVEWHCIEGPDEWVGTTLSFDLTHSVLDDGRDETRVLFTHGGWREPVPFMAHCSLKWGQFLLGLKSGLEGGPSIAFPADPPISSWG